MNCQMYKISISLSSPQIIEPAVNCLDKNIFMPKNRNPKPKQRTLGYRHSQPATIIDERITEKIRQKSPFREIWTELIEPNFETKDILRTDFQIIPKVYDSLDINQGDKNLKRCCNYR